MIRLLAAIACTLQIAGAVQAAEVLRESGVDIPRWQSTASAADVYMDSVESNRALLRKSLRDCTDRLASHIVSYGPAAVMLGAAAAVTLIDTRLKVGDSPYLNMEFRAAASEDRSLRLVFHRTW